KQCLLNINNLMFFKHMSEKIMSEGMSPAQDEEKSHLEMTEASIEKMEPILTKDGWKSGAGHPFIKEIQRLDHARVNSTDLPDGTEFTVLFIGDNISEDEEGWFIKEGKQESSKKIIDDLGGSKFHDIWDMVVQDGELIQIGNEDAPLISAMTKKQREAAEKV
ncbi:MAG: hypothetical protein ABH820_01775, partial [Patescibacteria group bacterium]